MVFDGKLTSKWGKPFKVYSQSPKTMGAWYFFWGEIVEVSWKRDKVWGEKSVIWGIELNNRGGDFEWELGNWRIFLSWGVLLPLFFCVFSFIFPVSSYFAGWYPIHISFSVVVAFSLSQEFLYGLSTWWSCSAHKSLLTHISWS